MSKGNPEKAVAAILPGTVRTQEGLEVRPMTLAMWAALERIKSPLVTGEDAPDTLAVLPSLYVLTHGPEAIFEPDLATASVRWADALPVSALASVQRACSRQLQTVVDVLPEIKKKPSRETTDGSPRSSTGPRRPTAGDGVKRSTRSRSPRSSS